jgi:hypothetical protein
MATSPANARRPDLPDTQPDSDPVWVFESQADTDLRRGAPALARACRGAVDGEHDGMTGANYALLTRDVDGTLLPWPEIKASVTRLFDTMNAHPTRKFCMVPSARGKSEDEHARYADLFHNAPANCQLMGRTLERLGRLKSVRVILLDANITIIEDERARILNQYFAANEGLWNAEYIEIVSIGAAQSLVANAKYATGRRYRHRIISADPARYGEHAAQVRELLSVGYATKLVCLNDPTGTSTGTIVGALNLASTNGLQIDDMLIQ